MKSFFLIAQAAVAEADEQKRFCSGAVQYFTGVGLLLTGHSSGQLLFHQYFQESVIY